MNQKFQKELTKYIPRLGRIEIYTAAIVNDFKGRSKLQDQERKNLVAELERTNKRLQNARIMKVDGDLADDDFRILKTDCNNRIEELEKKLSQLSNKNSEINALLEQSLPKLSKLDVLFENGSVEDRRRIISSMFPENLLFDGKAYRTPRINEGANLIFQKMKELEGIKKTRQIQKIWLCLVWCTRRDSNSYRRYRKPKFYPLNYGC
jgi:site-specific DNA recombinase